MDYHSCSTIRQTCFISVVAIEITFETRKDHLEVDVLWDLQSSRGSTPVRLAQLTGLVLISACASTVVSDIISAASLAVEVPQKWKTKIRKGPTQQESQF